MALPDARRRLHANVALSHHHRLQQKCPCRTRDTVRSTLERVPSTKGLTERQCNALRGRPTPLVPVTLAGFYLKSAGNLSKESSTLFNKRNQFNPAARPSTETGTSRRPGRLWTGRAGGMQLIAIRNLLVHIRGLAIGIVNSRVAPLSIPGGARNDCQNGLRKNESARLLGTIAQIEWDAQVERDFSRSPKSTRLAGNALPWLLQAMLKRLAVQNFKSLASVTVELPRMAVLFGPNASGKSNFLDAIHALSSIGTERTLQDALSARVLRGYPIEAFTLPAAGLSGLLSSPSARFSLEADLSTPQLTRRTTSSFRYRIEVEIKTDSGRLSNSAEFLRALSQAGSEKGTAAIEVVGDKFRVRRQKSGGSPRFEPLELNYSILSANG